MFKELARRRRSDKNDGVAVENMRHKLTREGAVELAIKNR